MGLHISWKQLFNKVIRKANFDFVLIYKAGYRDNEESFKNVIYCQSPSQSKSASPAFMAAFNHKSKRNIFTVDTSNRQSSTQSLQALDLTAVFAIHLKRSVSVWENVATKQLK